VVTLKKVMVHSYENLVLAAACRNFVFCHQQVPPFFGSPVRRLCAGGAPSLEAQMLGEEWSSIQHGAIPKGGITWWFQYRSLVDFCLWVIAFHA